MKLLAALAAFGIPAAPVPDGPPLRVSCPARPVDCAEASGRILYVERVDPDGDGDLHVVLATDSITAPGITAVDVRPGLRPARDPRAGDLAAAAGPVQTGSFGQQQIHALRFRVRRSGETSG